MCPNIYIDSLINLSSKRSRHVQQFDIAVIVVVVVLQLDGRIGRASGGLLLLLLLRHGGSSRKGDVVRGRRNRRAENDVHETRQVVLFVTAVVVVAAAAVAKVQAGAAHDHAAEAGVISQGGQQTLEGDGGFRLLVLPVHLEFLAPALDLGEASLAERTGVFGGTPCFDTVKTELVIAAVNGGGTIAF